jgi:hypothetical protein
MSRFFTKGLNKFARKHFSQTLLLLALSVILSNSYDGPQEHLPPGDISSYGLGRTIRRELQVVRDGLGSRQRASQSLSGDLF